MKTVERESDFTRICSSETPNNIELIVCKISTERRSEMCHLTYRHGRDFLNGCDSRFTLVQENEAVFLHLTNLKGEDSGYYTCECTADSTRTYTLHLYVTVKGQSTSSAASVLLGLFGTAGVITIAGFIFSYWRKNHRLPCVIFRSSYSTSATPGLSVHETLGCRDEDPYAALQQPTNDLYQTTTSLHLQRDTCTDLTRSIESVYQEMDPNDLIYENI
ncbi:uncharacterized protein LOC115798841 [Archocentrus centrarchus]|uniref:uncharacterized protein LOC115798841 n=1 Tax=Archocentrus centrarchus TaxID=63155 RepID=UPI0011E9C864|nr:uncharacterized protein LOC115798841 [Archocentrus centrarchus]